MQFLIADTFTDSLARLTGDEQKVAKTAAFDLQMNPARPSQQFHKLDRAKDKAFWSVRVSADLRMIVHRTPGSLLLCYVDHHDRAYEWASRRRLETHPRTGAAQLVEIRETVQEVFVPVYTTRETPSEASAPLFGATSDEDLLSYGVPPEWIADVKAADEDALLALADHLPAEAAEALLELATGGRPRVTQPTATVADAFDHPDAKRRFRVMTNVEELQRALEFPWEKWAVFLHPEQREWVERDYSGPARVSGSAGTGKTIVALHRAVHLARSHPEARVLLVTFSDTLAHALHIKLRRLIGNEPRLAERIDVHSFGSLGTRLHQGRHGEPKLATRDELRTLLREASETAGEHRFTLHFLLTEWEQVVDAWQLANWQDYRDVARLGRRTRLPEGRRAVLWSIFEQVCDRLQSQGLLTPAALFARLTADISDGRPSPYDFAVVDEAQDLSVAQMRFLAALAGDRPNGLFFAGDLGQRIFQQPFSWKSLGVDIRGRSRTLRVNYRTSHQVRQQADRLLAAEITDMDGNTERRSDAVSVFNGPPPDLRVLEDPESEAAAVGVWVAERIASGVLPHEIGVFVRSAAQLARASRAIEKAGQGAAVLDERVAVARGSVSICTMHLAKGLEFRSVVVMACDDEVVPLQERIESVGDEADLQEVYDTERHLLYVACTRAREHLLIAGVEPASEFLDDLRS